MTRRSTVTVRERPVAGAAAVSGSMKVHAETFVVETGERIEIQDLTDRVMTLVRASGVREGLVSLCPLHTTCTVLINEYQKALVADMRAFLDRLVPRGQDWLHNDPEHSDCDRANADAHLRTLLLGHGLTLQVNHGEVVLGQWQRILLAELDGPRTRSVRLMAMGV